jgi:DNA-binding NarL/FixJ family response regulator
MLILPPMLKEMTCLIVDDDEIDRLTLAAFLDDYPFIKIAGIFDSPVKALAAARESKPDILFLDIDMPEMSGLHFYYILPGLCAGKF